jgi:hypothetical protein
MVREAQIKLLEIELSEKNISQKQFDNIYNLIFTNSNLAVELIYSLRNKRLLNKNK